MFATGAQTWLALRPTWLKRRSPEQDTSSRRNVLDQPDVRVLLFQAAHILDEGDAHNHQVKGSARSQLSQAGMCIPMTGQCGLCCTRRLGGLRICDTMANK